MLVVTSGDRRVDERKVAALVGAIGRADADFVKAKTGFTIGGVSPVRTVATSVPAGIVTVAAWGAESQKVTRAWAAAGG